MPEPELSFEIATDWSFLGSGSARFIVEGHALARTIPGTVGGLLGRVWDGIRPVTIRFGSEPDACCRAELTDAVARLVRAELGGEEAADGMTVEGWQGQRYRIDPAFQPRFSVADTDNAMCVLGVWSDPTTLRTVLVDGRSTEPEGDVWVSLSHWHPGSLASGSWGSSLARVGPGLLCATWDQDEDGTYVTLLPEPTDPDGVARSILEHVGGQYLYGAESWIPILAALLGPDVSDLTPFRLDMLPGTDNTGYEIERVLISPPDDAAEAFRRLAAPTDAQRQRLRAAILAHVAEPMNSVTLEDLAEPWQRLAREADPEG